MRVRTLTVATLLFVAAPLSLHADPIVLTGRGTVASFSPFQNEPLFGARVVVGDPFTFSISFDPRATFFLPNFSDFGDPNGSLTVTLGGATFTPHSPALPGNDITVSVSHSATSDDLSIDAIHALNFTVSFFIRGFGGSFLNSATLPTDLAAALTAAPTKDVHISEGSFDADGGATGSVIGANFHFSQTPAPSPTPEPASLLLLGTALAGIAARRWIHVVASPST